MRVIKWIFGIALLLVVLTAIAVAYFALSFDANSYKTRIINTVKNETGRDLTLDGELDITFYPWLGINMNQATLSNAEGFSAEHFLTLDEATIRLQLIPLLKKNIVADRIELNGVEVWLERHADGKANWDDIAERFKSEGETTTQAESDMTASIAGLSVKNAGLHWTDAKDGQNLDLDVKRFDTGVLIPGEPTELDGEFHFTLKDPQIQGQIIAKGVTRLNQTEPFILSEPELSIELQGVDIQAENISANIDTSELRYENGNIILMKPDIAYVIANMPSLGKSAKGQLKADKLTVSDGDITLPVSQLNIDISGSALVGEDLKASIQSTEIRYQNGDVTLLKPNISYDITNISGLGKHATGQLQADKLSMLESGDIHLPKTQLNIDLNGSELPGDSLIASLQTDNMSLLNQVLSLKTFSATAEFKGDPWPKKEFSTKVNGPDLALDLNKETLNLSAFTAQALGLDMEGSVSGKNVLQESLTLSGKINIADFSPKVIAPKLDIALPEMSNEAWAQANLSGNYLLTTNSIAMSNLKTEIDGTQWTGKAAFTDIEKKKISFDLAAASLDANRLLPPKQSKALKDKSGSAASEAAIDAIVIPQDALKEWDAKGTVKLGSLKFANIESTNLEAGIDLLDGHLRVFPSKANFFGGQYSGDIRLDVSGATPKLQVNEKVTDIDLAQLGEAMWENSMMTGRTNAHIEMVTTGNTLGVMQEKAEGNVDFIVSDGVMHGFDLNYAVANAISIFKNKSLSAVVDTKQTAFENLSATATLSKGILQNNDFLAVMPRMRIRGKGLVNTLDTSINYQVSADILESKSASTNTETKLSLDELVGATIPIKISGSLLEPKIRPDVAAFMKSKLEQEVRDQVKDKLENKIKDRLGGVLGGVLGGSSEPKSVPVKEPGSQATQESGSAPKVVDPQVAPEVAPEVVPEVVPEETVPKADPIEEKKEDLEQKAKDKLKDIFGGL